MTLTDPEHTTSGSNKEDHSSYFNSINKISALNSTCEFLKRL